MNSALERFKQLLADRLLPEFCNDPLRRYDLAGFKIDSIRLTEYDAGNFLRAWDSGLLEHRGRGLYRAARSSASEQWFWQGLKSLDPRPITLWLEPIITVGVLARLHLDLGWPRSQIGMQSKDWAFDVVAFRPDRIDEWIACEVKKTEGEIETLVSLMEQYAAKDHPKPDALKGKELNAYRKLMALKARRIPIFWAVGPGGLSKVYKAGLTSNGGINIIETNEALLRN